jgi:hypothetical protein
LFYKESIKPPANFGKKNYKDNYIYNYSKEAFKNKPIRNFTIMNFALVIKTKKEIIYKKYKKLFSSNN